MMVQKLGKTKQNLKDLFLFGKWRNNCMPIQDKFEKN
jgi:hypothetical protein